MTLKQKIINYFNSGEFSTTAKLMMVLYYWIWGGITDDDAEELSLKVEYTFTKPTTTGQTILTGAINYTIVTLVTAYHNNDFSTSIVYGDDIIYMIAEAKSSGYITDSEETTLKGLGW